MRQTTLFLILLLMAWPRPASAIVDEGEVAPDFSLTDLETGGAFSLSQFEGQVVVINFWAYW